MTSIKEALEPCPFCGGKPELLNGGPGNWFVRCTDCKCTTNDVQEDAAVQLWHRRAALATFQPDGERREAIARIIDPTVFDVDWMHRDDKRYVESLRKADLILASGLVQNEAGWRDISTAPKNKAIMLCVDGFEPCSGRWWPLDSCWVSFDWEGHFDTDLEMSSYVAGTSYDPTHWKPLPAPPIRSARDGGAET